MAKLTFILVNPENVAFMQKVAEVNDGKVEEGVLTVSVSAPKLVIKKDGSMGYTDGMTQMPILNGDHSYSIVPVKSEKVKTMCDIEG